MTKLLKNMKNNIHVTRDTWIDSPKHGEHDGNVKKQGT